jgi:FtsZ-binding cell division protein ZapB
LQQSLSGNAHIAIICTISPTLRCAEESNNTLKFGSRAKLIKMDAKVNETMDDKTLLKAYRREIDELREKLALMENLVQAPQLRKSNSKKKAPTPRHVNPYSEHDDDDNVSASSSSSDSKSSDDEKEGSGQQALLLQVCLFPIVLLSIGYLMVRLYR